MVRKLLTLFQPDNSIFIQDNTFDSTERLIMFSAMLAEGITDLEQF